MLSLQPVSFDQACRFTALHHRHHIPPQGHKYSIGLTVDGQLVGVIIVGRPVARHLDDGLTLEVTRCTTDGTPHACSKLYATAWRAARALGYRRLITYTLASEPGTSLRAAGWRVVGQTNGGSWDRPSRARTDRHPIGQKTIWEAAC